MGKHTRNSSWPHLAWVAAAFLALALLTGASYAQAGNYLLSPNDLVEVEVYQELEMTTKARVGNDGTISMKFIDSVKIGGRSVSEAGQLIRARLAKGYFVNPQVTVNVLEFAKRRFTVLGQVIKGGTFDFPDNGTVDLLSAIGMAGGYTRIADPSKVTVKRRSGGKDEVFNLNAKKMAGDPAANRFEVQSGDTITVGESIF